MLNCELCDYYKSLYKNNEDEYEKISYCEFSGFIFKKEPEEYDIEYPCRNISFDEYATDLSKKQSINQVESIDWRFMYLKNHKKPLKDKKRISA